MKQAAMLLATGYEEGEALFVVDILRRAGMRCDIVSVDGLDYVEGSHGIVAKADRGLDDSLKEWDMLILPGGMPGAANLRDHSEVIRLVRHFDQEGKWIAAICAAPIVLEQAGVAEGRALTSYPGEKYKALFGHSDYREDAVVTDGNLITSRGPATTLPFAYALVDALGGDSGVLKKGMLYHMAQ